MKLARRTLSVALVVVVLMAALVIPASALESEWLYEFRNQFPTLSQGSSRTAYIYALQRFLLVHPSSKSAMSSAGGVDGVFGAGTGNAVKKFQTYGAQYLLPGMAVDGIAGGDTWVAVAKCLNQSGAYMTYSGNDVYKTGTYNSKDALYSYRNGGYYYFHTIVGEVPIY